MGAVETAAEFVPVRFAGRWVGHGAEAVGRALATGSHRAAAKAGAGYIARNTASLAANEAFQEAGQEMATAFLDGVVNAAVDYEARHGSLDGWSESVPLDKIAEDVGRTVIPAVVSSLGLTAGTAGASGIGAGVSIHERVARIKAFNTARNAARAGVETLRGRREAKGVHMPAYDLAIESETRTNVARMKQRLGRELTDDELVAAQEAARERVAYEDFKQMYNAWSAETDEAKRDAFLNRQGFTAGEKAKLISAFDTIFAYRAGAQFGGQVADVAESIRASLQSVGLAAELETREDGSALLRFGGVDAPATEIRFVQQVQDPDAEAHAAMGVTPDGVFIRAADGTEVDATQPVNAVIEIQRQSQGGSTFLLGHELAHNLLDVMRRTGTLTQEMDAQLAKKFKGKDGAFDEEAFADAFGAELRDAFTLQEEARVAKAPKTKVGRILRGMADTVRDWAYATFAFRRAREDAKAAQANAPASVLEAFLARQGTAQKPAEEGGQQNQGAGAQGAETSQAKPGENGPVPADGQEGATRVRMEGGGEAVGPVRFHLGPVYTGAGTAYDRPDIGKVGTGIGLSLYGWGLYATQNKSLAKEYADAAKGKKRTIFDAPERAGLRYVGTERVEGTPAIHAQTWWTHRAEGDESHLLEWDEPVSEENLRRVLDQYDAEGLDDKNDAMARDDVEEMVRGARNGRDLYYAAETLMAMTDDGFDFDDAFVDDDNKDAVQHIKGKAKEASEFLYRAGIDGMKYRDQGATNYVSFSDENLRVDKRWVWDGERYVEDRAFTQGAKYHVPPPADENIAIANEGVTEETFTASLDKMLQERVAEGSVADNDGLRDATLEFYREFHDKKVQLSDGRFVYFVPLVNEARGLSRDEAWAEYAIHSVTNDRLRRDGTHERAFNSVKASALKDIERILKEENVFPALNKDNAKDSIIFFGIGESGKRIDIVTRLDEAGNIKADLTEITTVVRDAKRKSPRPMSLTEAVKAVEVHQGTGYSPMTDGESKARSNTEVKYHLPGQAEDAAYLAAVEQGDMETARRMVEEAAKRAGYTIEAYHGSDQFGFTVFNPERSDDERSLFFAGSQALASTYTEARDISRIGGKAFLDGNFKTFEELSKALEPLGLRLELSGAKLVDGDRAIEVKEFRKHKNEYETEITLVPYDTEALNEAAVASANDYAKATYGMSLQEAGGLDEAAKNDIRRFYREWRYEHRSDYSTTPNQVAAAINRRKREPFRSKPGIYEVALKLENPLVVDADGANWNAIRLDDKTLEDYKEFLEETYGNAEFHGDPEEARTREISEYAEARGYDGVIFKNLFDYGPMGVAEGTDTVYVAFDGRQAKSLDPVTYDDEGRVIPLSERFNPANPDIRHHIPDRGAPRFSETEAGKAAVAEAFDAMTEGMWDLISDPTGRSQRKGAKKQQDVTTEEGFAKEVNIRMGQFGRAGGPRLQELKKRLSAEQWQDVLGTVFEIGHRFDVWHKDGGLLDASMRRRVADYLQDIIRNRASMLGRRAYMAGRAFAWRQAREAERAAVGEARREGREKLAEARVQREYVSRINGILREHGCAPALFGKYLYAVYTPERAALAEAGEGGLTSYGKMENIDTIE